MTNTALGAVASSSDKKENHRYTLHSVTQLALQVVPMCTKHWKLCAEWRKKVRITGNQSVDNDLKLLKCRKTTLKHSTHLKRHWNLKCALQIYGAKWCQFKAIINEDAVKTPNNNDNIHLAKMFAEVNEANKRHDSVSDEEQKQEIRLWCWTAQRATRKAQFVWLRPLMCRTI